MKQKSRHAFTSGERLDQLIQLREFNGSDVWDIWTELDLGNGWTAAYRLTPSRPRGQAAIGELRVFPTEPGNRVAGQWSAEGAGTKALCPRGGVTAKVLKSIRLGRVVPDFLLSLWSMQKFNKNASTEDRRRWGGDAYEPFAASSIQLPRKSKGAGRRPTTTDERYAQVAYAYRRAMDRGSPNAAEEVARELDLGGPAHVRMMVHRGAKKRGLIAGVGGDSWQLTPQAMALVETTKGGSRGKKTRAR